MVDNKDKGDIRSLITSKKRKKVPPRDASLVSNPKKTLPPEEIQTSDIPELKAELDSLPKMGKRLAVNLQEEIRQSLMELCDQVDVTPDTFIEASVVALKSQPELLKEILDDAQVRLAQRKQAGVIRRTLTMMEKYGT